MNELETAIKERDRAIESEACTIHQIAYLRKDNDAYRLALRRIVELTSSCGYCYNDAGDVAKRALGE